MLPLLHTTSNSELTLMSQSLGAVSGPKGCQVKVQDALKKPWPEIAQTAEKQA